VAVRRLANPVTFCDGHEVFLVAASGQIWMAVNTAITTSEDTREAPDARLIVEPGTRRNATRGTPCRCELRSDSDFALQGPFLVAVECGFRSRRAVSAVIQLAQQYAQTRIYLAGTISNSLRAGFIGRSLIMPRVRLVSVRLGKPPR
jgi:hypothetical protein